MGFFDWLTGEKNGVFIEGRASKPHKHKDGSYGRDIYAAKVTYKNGIKVKEEDAGWGHIKENSPDPDRVK